MQLKGLVRFFTILLIIYSLYQLSFTFFVKKHEKKLAARAMSYVKSNFESAIKKYPGNKDSQEIYQERLDRIYQERLQRLKDSTRDVVLTWGPSGKITYQKAKEQELNLGLDLQGGMNVTMEVEMKGLIRALANNTNDPKFLEALQNADKRKKNSDADMVSLFAEEYEKLNPGVKLASFFSGASSGKITLQSSNSEVRNYLSDEAKAQFDRTEKVLRSRIDQFGVAQPNINADRNKAIIIVELPGVQDKERVRKQLQSSANLQFWELYNLGELAGSVEKAQNAFYKLMGGTVKDTTKTDTTNTNKPDSTGKIDSTKKPGIDTLLSQQIGKEDTSKKGDDTKLSADDEKKQLYYWVRWNIDQQNRTVDNGVLGYINVKDSALVRSYLEAPAVRSNFPNQLYFLFGIPENPQIKKAGLIPLYAIKNYGKEKADLEGDAIKETRADYNQRGEVEVSMSMTKSGSDTWAKMTTRAAGKIDDERDNKHIAISLDNVVYSAPRVNEPITGGNSSISGGFESIQEAQDLANVIKVGKLAAPAKIVQEQQVGPTLGRAAIRGGTMAFLVSFIVIFLLMLVYYNTAGWVANIALILNLLFTVGVLAGLGASLTAPGIAGLVLTIGMAVDTNVIIYERIKEELGKGKGYIPAINEGYKRSLPPVLDAHVTTFLTAMILFYFGLGPVKGFATTQMLGIILSLFCGILVSRWVTEWFTSKKKHLEYFTPISKRIFKHAKFKFIEYRKVAYMISLLVLGLGIASYFNGFDYGVEFEGGRSYTIQFDKKVDVDQIRGELRTAFENENPVIKTIGDNSKLDITTSYLIHDTRPEADSIVQTKLLAGLKSHLPPNVGYKEFDAKYKVGSKTVLPTISDDLLNGAKKAVTFALIIIFLYIFIRFRDWRYSLGTVVALLHDVFVTLIVFSFARTIVPFPLEIDQHFIAAVLTVVGFSMNDTVIVFDRIREDSRLMPNAPKAEVINRAINETLSRTVMTSLTVFLTILILFIVGGEVTKGFAFAMLIGVITGTYSSIFVAAPILVDLGGKRALGSAPKTVVKTQAKPVTPATAKS
jgi:SecD/SecF fusion protein